MDDGRWLPATRYPLPATGHWSLVTGHCTMHDLCDLPLVALPGRKVPSA